MAATEQPDRLHPSLLIAVNAAWNIVNFRRGLIARLQREGYAIVVAAPADEHRTEIEAMECRFVPIAIAPHGRSPLVEIALLGRYLALLRRERPAAFLGFTAKPNIWGSLAAAMFGIPAINNVAGLGRVFDERGPTSRLLRGLYRVALRRSARALFQNREDMALFVGGGLARADAAELLPGSGVDLDRFRPVSRVRRDGAPFVFLLPGRLLRAKGVGEFVEAGRRMRSAGTAAEFRILGFTDDDDPAYVARAELDAWQAAGTIHFLGRAADVRPHLAAADAIVLPTYYPEGTPRALLEAAAMGKPIVTCDRPGCRDVVTDGVNGFLVPPRDPAALAAAMGRLAQATPAELHQFGTASRRIVVQRFDERIVTDRYVAILRDIMAFPTSFPQRSPPPGS